MDLEYMLMLENESGLIGPEFLSDNPGIGIPYLTVTCIAIIVGTLGNSLVIAAVLTNKVSQRKCVLSSTGYQWPSASSLRS